MGEMQFNVGQLLIEPIGSTRRYTLEEAFFDPLEDGAGAPVAGWVKLTRTDKGIWAQGVLETRVASLCSRCLEGFHQALTVSLDEQYYPVVDPQTGVPTPAALLEEGFLIDAHRTLDLQEAVRQCVVASLPMKSLCRVDCRGICPQCGSLRNIRPCQCPEESRTSPWRPLQTLLSKKTLSP
jgi:uncharacterized protein